MKAQNLSICILNSGCDKNCPYCVSKMTGYIKADDAVFWRNYQQLDNFCMRVGISNILVTGKGEPLFNDDSLDVTKLVLQDFKEYVTELQTNGNRLDEHIIDTLNNCYLNILAVSFDSFTDIEKYKYLFWKANHLGIIVRATICITNNFNNISFSDLIKICKENHINQLTLRQLTIPDICVDTPQSKKAQEYIGKIDQSIYKRFIFELDKIEKREIRSLINGALVYDIDGISFTHFPYCIQEKNSEDDIRSLIYMENGHLYDTWDSDASVIF